MQADCVVLSTDDPNGQCYISTSQLDGERNLKPKLAPTLTMKGFEDLKSIQISYENPVKDIYRFEGNLQVGDNQNTLDLKQFIPRGAYVKNSQKIKALVVYTGVETKLVMNQGNYVFKISRLAYLTNWILGVLLVFFVLAIILSSQVGNRIGTQSIQKHLYIFPEYADGTLNTEIFTWASTLSFYLLYNGLFPLDLPIATLFAQTFYTFFMLETDVEMVCEEKSAEA